jgi:hypothetical protein
VDNLWIKPVPTGVAFEQQNFLTTYPQVIHNLLEVIHSLSTEKSKLSTAYPQSYAQNKVLIVGIILGII